MEVVSGHGSTESWPSRFCPPTLPIVRKRNNSRIVSKPEGIRLLPHPPLLWVSAQARRARIQADGEGWRVLTRWDSPYRKRRLAASWDHR